MVDPGASVEKKEYAKGMPVIRLGISRSTPAVVGHALHQHSVKSRA